MDELSRTYERVTIGRSKIGRLLFALRLHDIAGMKISTSKTEALHLSKNPIRCSLKVGGVSLKQVEKLKYLGVAFMSDERQDKELDV